ncbi:MAG: hypothetical protein SFY56_14540 [Bacteroidota bacterium]|nr:hypothetical protein [Bacteroidota bacterium]
MKFVFCLFIVLTFNSGTFASSNISSASKKIVADSTYIIVGLEENDAATINSVRTQIAAINDCKILTYVHKKNVFVLKFYNVSTNLAKEALFQLVQEAVTTNTLYLKVGTLKSVLVYMPKSDINNEIKQLISN